MHQSYIFTCYDILFLKTPSLEALCLEYLLAKSRVCVGPIPDAKRSWISELSFKKDPPPLLINVYHLNNPTCLAPPL